MTNHAQIGAKHVTEPAEDTTEVRPPKPFTTFVVEQRRGLLASELTDELRKLTAAVVEHSKPGSLTVTITLTPSKKIEGVLQISDEVKVKTPQGDRDASLFYADAKGNLDRSDPRQPQIPGLREAGQSNQRSSA